MRKITFLTIMVLNLFLWQNAGKAQDENTFYVNGNKVTELTCYDFDVLSFRFNITPEMFGYDKVAFSFSILNPDKVGTGFAGYFKSEDQEYVYSCIMTKSMFETRFHGRKRGEIMIFEKGANESHNFNETDASDIRQLTRSMLQYTALKAFVEGAKIRMRIMGGTFQGYKEYVEDDMVKKKEEYDWAKIKDFDQNGIVLLKNRVKAKTGLSNEFPTDVVHNGPCYPTNNSSADDESSSASSSGSSAASAYPDGPYEQKYSSGATQLVGQFQDHKPTGNWKEYYEDGKLKEEENYVNGLEEGLETQYSEEGEVIQKTEYKAGKKNGKCQTFDGGNIHTEINYTDDKKDGKEIDYYSNGKKQVEGTYKNGVKDGTWKEYDEDGKITSTTIYKDGSPQ